MKRQDDTPRYAFGPPDDYTPEPTTNLPSRYGLRDPHKRKPMATLPTYAATEGRSQRHKRMARLVLFAAGVLSCSLFMFGLWLFSGMG